MSEVRDDFDEGPEFFSNWRAQLRNLPSLGGYEYPLYGDACIVGHGRAGPYMFINTVASASARKLALPAPVIVLRVDVHKEWTRLSMEKTDAKNYHGGSLSDEAAAIVCLATGTRLKAGPVSRQFERGGDPRGLPVAHYGFERPILLPGEYGTILPSSSQAHSLEDLAWISDWFETDPRDEIALIRAARLYQEAIWIADAEPELAWLLLVSAIEAAANRWRKSSGRSSRNFLEFTLNFLPSPPVQRPPAGFQVNWERDEITKTIRTIYRYRCKALHEGIPFPAPMCGLPRIFDSSWSAPNEGPLGLAEAARGGVWRREDTPMLLHTFEYVTRNVLRAWWSSLRSAAS